MWVAVQCRKLPAVIIWSLYRHPKASAVSFNYVEDVLRLVSLRKKSFFVFGDFNGDLLVGNNKLDKKK